MTQESTPAGWYHAQGDPPRTTRYWDGAQWVGEPQLSQSSGFDTEPVHGYGASTAALEPVSAGARIGGRIIDGIIWSFINIVTALPAIFQTVSNAFENVENGGEVVVPEVSTVSVFISGFAGLALVVAYETVGNASGGTLGKRAIGSRVVKADGTGLDMVTSFRRMWLYIGYGVIGMAYAAVDPVSASGLTNLSGLIFVVVASAGLIMLFANSRKQTPWDLVGGTIVVAKSR